MYRTKDQVALEFIAEGQRRGIRPIGIVICIATGLVESQLIVYANGRVAESLELPHDAVGWDSYSVGPLQQQVRKGDNGQWWWADAATCMDPTRSAGLFYDRLVKWRYWEDDVTPGWYAQEVQDSAYPDRYDQRMADAQDIYDRLVGQAPIPPVEDTSTMQEIDLSNEGNSSSRYGAAVRLFVLHTEEGNSNAQTLHDWMRTHEVSYHYTLDNSTAIDSVNTDRASWSVLDANSYCINLVFAGSKAGQSRQVWIDRYSNAIDYAAKLFVQDAAKYGPLVPDVIGRNYDAIEVGKAGGIDHSGITYGLGIGDHTDVGPNFPWDLFADSVRKHMGGVVIPPVVNDIDAAAAAAPWLGQRLTVGEQGTPDGRGRFAQFENGYVHWTATTGARPVPTNIFETWGQLGYEDGPLGYPVNYHTVLPVDGDPKIGDVQAFEGGTIYRKYGQPGYWVHGAIGNRWAREGFERSAWGWPVSNEVAVDGGGAYQDFEGGRIAWSVDGTVGLKPVGGPDTIVTPKH